MSAPGRWPAPDLATLPSPKCPDRGFPFPEHRAHAPAPRRLQQAASSAIERSVAVHPLAPGQGGELSPPAPLIEYYFRRILCIHPPLPQRPPFPSGRPTVFKHPQSRRYRSGDILAVYHLPSIPGSRKWAGSIFLPVELAADQHQLGHPRNRARFPLRGNLKAAFPYLVDVPAAPGPTESCACGALTEKGQRVSRPPLHKSLV